MYLSLNWLKDFVNIPKSITPEELGLRLTMHTVEIDGVEKQADKFRNIVVGKILEIKKHPDADRLQIAIIDTRQGAHLQIVCGAPNIKKGQFIAPKDVIHIIEKIKSTGNNKIMITERGTCFGYNNLVVDYRGMLEMKKFGYPVIFDATHSQQKPSVSTETGGTREYAIPMALGAIATGVDGLFIEVHPDPSKAKSDSATALHIADIEPLLKKVMKIRGII